MWFALLLWTVGIKVIKSITFTNSNIANGLFKCDMISRNTSENLVKNQQYQIIDDENK